MCRSPIIVEGAGHGCGQCLPCRINRRRNWAHRMMLEAQLHKSNSFATLTYRDADLPARGCLELVELQKWLKRFRFAIEPDRVRFFAVGEYGHEGTREFNPHFHVILFGFPPCIYGESTFKKDGSGSCCPFCEVVRDTWGKGKISLSEFKYERAQYCAKYVVKKMTGADDDRLDGRNPEFARMSLRPGIGAHYAPLVSAGLLQAGVLQQQEDVPAALRHGSRIVPFDRYMRQKLRLAVGRNEKTPPSALLEFRQKMLALRARAERLASDIGGSKAMEKKIFQKLLSDEHAGLAGSKIARFKMKSKGKL